MQIKSYASDFLNIFKPPVYEDETLNLMARMSYFCFITAALVTAYFAITLSDDDELIGRAICTIAAFSSCISLYLLKLEKFKLAILATVTVCFVFIILTSFFNRGAGSIPIQALPPIFLLIMTFLGKREIFVFGFLTVASLLSMGWLESAGFYGPGPPYIPVDNPEIVSLFLFVSNCLFLHFVIKNSVGNSQNLIEARMVAEEHNRAKTEYFSTMTHELRTPLNAIIGYSEDIIDLHAEGDVMVDSQVVKDVHYIHTSGKYLLSLINDILDLSKIEADRMNLFVNQFSGLELLNEIEATVYPMAKTNGNKIVVAGLSEAQKLITDRQKLRQILINLLSNAAKFTVKGEIRVEFRLLNQELYQFKVVDTGIGIPEEALPHLFNSYSQADNSFSSFKGTGLGLAITKKLVEFLDGDLQVESEVNEGTIFTVILPALHADSKKKRPISEIIN
ncbi:MAG: HAMP domain-containing sensor histidine kinase [Chloroflexota bacterium]